MHNINVCVFIQPRSATVAVSKPSSSSTTRAGRRDKDKAKETPAFMKEFQKKKEKVINVMYY